MEATLQGVFRDGFESYFATRKLPLKHHKAAHAIMRCRTEEQGGHERYCPEGHEGHIEYHSCRHRSCPKCSSQPKAAWAEKQFERLLPVDHYHVIFTLPHELLDVWRYNQKWCVDTFFHVVNATLMTLLKDKKHLGAQPGIIMSLHTWGRNLILHPHIHCLITGGGLTGEEQWKACKNHFLLPGRVVSALYRGQFLAALWRGVKRGEISLAGGDTPAIEYQLKAAGKKKWNVRIQPPYDHGEGVMKYIARYVKGGAISNHRIQSADTESVTFRYRDHRDGKDKVQTLARDGFIARVLEHVAEPHQHMIRHYGLYGHQAKVKREQCRKMLGHSVQRPHKYEGKAEKCCSVCGQILIRGREWIKNSLYKVSARSYVQQHDKPDMANAEIIRRPCGV